MKKLIAMLLTLAMVASIGVAAFAAHEPGSSAMPLDSTNWKAEASLDAYIASLSSKQDYVLEANAIWKSYRQQVVALDYAWTGITGKETNSEYKAAREAIEANYAAQLAILGKAAKIDSVNYATDNDDFYDIFNFDNYKYFDIGAWDGKTSVLEDDFGYDPADASTAPYADLIKAAKTIKNDNAYAALFGKDATTGDVIKYIASLITPVVPTAEPDTAEPDTAEPDTAEPDTAEPDTAEPDTAEPVKPVPDAKTQAILDVRAAIKAKMDASKAGAEDAKALLDAAKYNKAAAEVLLSQAKKSATDAKKAIDDARKGAMTEAQAAVLNAQANAYATLAKGISDAVQEYVAAVDVEIINFYNSFDPAEVVYYAEYEG